MSFERETFSLRDLESLHRQLVRLNLLEDPKLRDQFMFLAKHWRRLSREVIEYHVDYFTMRIIGEGDPNKIHFLEHPEALLGRKLDGRHRLAWIVNSGNVKIPFGLDETEMAHMAITGSSGSGKSCLQRLAFHSLCREDLPGWIFEPQEDHSQLCNVIPSLRIVNADNLYFNPQQVPEGMHPDIWLSNYVDCFCENQQLLSGGNTAYTSALRRLYEIYGVYDGSKNFPTLVDTFNYLQRTPPTTKTQGEREIRGRVIQRIDSLLAVMRRNLDVSQGLTSTDIRGKSVLFQLGELKPVGYDLVTTTLAYQEYVARNVNKDLCESYLVIGWEEGSRPFSRKNEIQAHTQPRNQELLERCRKLKMIIIICAQSFADLARYVRANCSQIFFFYSSSGDDKSAFGRAAQLTPEQFYDLSKLEPRKFCILSTTKYHKAIMLETINFDKYLSRM